MTSRTKAITAAEETQFSFKKSQAGTLYGIGLALSISTGILTCVSLNLMIVSKADGAMPCVILNICQAMILTAILTAFGQTYSKNLSIQLDSTLQLASSINGCSDEYMVVNVD
jgi:hypothetical protein